MATEKIKDAIPLKDLQKALIENWTGGVLSNWIDILKQAFPDAEIINYYGSKQGRINGILYDFIEEGVFGGSPKIIIAWQRF